MGQINVILGQGGIGRTVASVDGVSALCMGAPVAPSGLSLNTNSPKLTSLQDAVDLGIDPAFDTDNGILAYHHIKEFFRIVENGELYVRFFSGYNMEEALEEPDGVPALVNDPNILVSQVEIVLNAGAAYVPSPSGGFDEDVINAIPKAQDLANDQRNKKRPVLFLIEGFHFNGTVQTATDLRSLECPDVCVTIAADNDVSTSNPSYAAVGMTLGAIAKAKVSENIGWTDKFNLKSITSNEMTNVGLSNDSLASLYEDDYENLTAKGIIFARNYPNEAGVYFDDFPTCDVATSDYAYGENRRTINKAIKLAYKGLFPFINAPLLLDPATGKMEAATAKSIEAAALAEMNVLLQDNDVSGLNVFVDPNQDVQSTGEVKVVIEIVQVATGRKIRIELGFTRNIS